MTKNSPYYEDKRDFVVAYSLTAVLVFVTSMWFGFAFLFGGDIQ
jgi:hypothetical protein